MEESPNQKNIVHGSIMAGGNVHIGDYTVMYVIEAKEVNIPHRLTNYIPTNADYLLGRETELETITRYLSAKKPTVLVNGIGGIGKTSVAIKYMALHRGEYKHLAWLTVQSSILETFISNSALLESLQITEKVQELILEKQLDSAFELVIHKLNILEKTLVVLDNANDLEDLEKYEHLFDTADCHFLITSRTYPTEWTTILIDSLPEEEAIRLFKKLHPSVQASDEAIKSLLLKLYYHTLLIELVAKSIESAAYLFEEIQEIVEKEFIHHESLNQEVVSTGKHGSIVKDNLKRSKIEDYIWLIFSNIKGLDKKSKNILMAMTLLPLAYMIERKDLKDHFSFFNMENPMPAVVILVERGWVDRVRSLEKKTYFKMHPLIADVVKKHLELTVDYAEAYINHIATLILYNNTDPEHDLFEKNKNRPLAERLSDLFFEDYTEGISELLESIGNLENEFGFYQKSCFYRERALMIAESIFDDNHETIFVRRSNLANVYKDLDKNDKSAALLELVLVKAEENLGKDHPHVAAYKSNLALVYKDLDKNDQAATLMEAALASNIKNFGKEHPEVAKSQLNLALVYRNLGKYDQAVALMEATLASNLKNFGKEHINVALAKWSLAAIYIDINRKLEAKVLLEAAYQTFLVTLGAEHPTTLSIHTWFPKTE